MILLPVVVMVLWSVVGVGSQCVQDGSCKCHSSAGTIDLSPITGTSTQAAFKDLPDSAGAWLYSFSPCTPFTEGSQECNNVAVCQLSNDLTQSFPAGTVDSAKFGEGPTSGSIIVSYSQTDSQGTFRATIVTLQCDSAGGTDVLTVHGEDPGTKGVYTMTLSSRHCCPSGGPGPSGGDGGGGLSVGSILCIVLAALVFAYIAAGIGIQKGVRKAAGKEVFPNYTLWASLPGLIKDGFLFVFTGCKGKRNYDKI